jgi:ElaB/YqjD/DUF883 family membrane-anchored ribosome-binding protein
MPRRGNHCRFVPAATEYPRPATTCQHVGNGETMAERTQESRGARGGVPDVEVDTLKADIDALRTELVNVVQSIKGLDTTAVAAAKREPGTAVNRLASEAAAYTAEIAGVGRAQMAEFKQSIRDQPLMAVGIAFAVGLLFGRLRR